jgi:hypothetical protein
MDKFGVNTQKWRLGTTAEEVEKGATELSIYNRIKVVVTNES